MSAMRLGSGPGPAADQRTIPVARPQWRLLDPRVWDRRLVAAGPADRLVLLRILLVAVIGIRLLLRRWWVVTDRPSELFDPVFVLGWLDRPPAVTVVVAVWLVGLAAVAATLVKSLMRRNASPPFLVAWLALLVLAGLWGSSGKVMHNDVLLLTVSFPMLFAGSPLRGSEAHSPRWGWVPRAALVVLAVVYFLTGFQKLRHSGLEWVFSSNLSWVIRQGSSPFGSDLNRTLADQLWLTQTLAAGTLLFELAAPVLLAVRRARLLFALGATAMHLSIWALLGLDYFGWIFTVWAVVIPMTVIGDRIMDRRGGRRPVGSDA